MDDLLLTASAAARKAGDHLNRAFQDRSEVLSEEGRDIKLKADREAEAIILESLQATPHPVLAEESGEVGDIDMRSPMWVVDPLDGTFNYSRSQPLCCVSIALVQGNRPLLGVVYDFTRDELYSGLTETKEGFFNDQPLRVSSTIESAKASLATGFPVNRDYSSESLEGMIGYFQRFKKIRMFGTAALSLAWVSCGKVDAYYEEDIMYWDVAAGLALVEAAGGYVEIRDSNRLEWGKTIRCASSPSIWESI